MMLYQIQLTAKRQGGEVIHCPVFYGLEYNGIGVQAMI